MADQSKQSGGSAPPSRRSLHLLYHELRPARTDYAYALDVTSFDQQLALFAAIRQQNTGLNPEITFDDGHLSDFEYALPALQTHGLTARFFITAGWTSTRPGYMDWRQLRALHAAGQHIGAHGWSHILLTHCSDQQLEAELRDPRHALEDRLGASITTMSLPGGRANRRIFAACEAAGYTTVYTSAPIAETLPLGSRVGRLNIRGDMQLSWLLQLFKPGSSTLAHLERSHRIKSAAKNLLGDSFYARIWAAFNRQESNDLPFQVPPYENPARHQ